MRYTIFSSLERREFFFSTDHLQRYNSAVEIDNSFCVMSGVLPMQVVSRKSLPGGVVDTIAKMIMIFHVHENEIPNPDPLFEPEWHKSAALGVVYESEVF